jgi:hypothetical protein
MHAKGAPQVCFLVEGLRGAILVVLPPSVAAGQLEKQLVVLCGLPNVALLPLFVDEECLSGSTQPQAIVHALCAL